MNSMITGTAKQKSSGARFSARLKSMPGYSLMLIYAVVSIYPLFFAIISSFKSDKDIFLTPFKLPTSFSFENYVRAWKLANVEMYFKNSVILAVATVLVLVVICSMAGYVFGKFKFKHQGILYLFIISGMMIPVHSAIVPLSYMVGLLQLKNNYAMIVLLIVAFQIPISIMMMSGFMKSIPGELEEAAIIDGCGAFQILFKIIMPVSVPAIVTISIFNFLAAWNNLIIPLIFISDNAMKPLSIGLLTFFGERNSDYSGVLSAIVISSLVPFLAYVLLQEKVEKGMTAGAVKG